MPFQTSCTSNIQLKLQIQYKWGPRAQNLYVLTQVDECCDRNGCMPAQSVLSIICTTYVYAYIWCIQWCIQHTSGVPEHHRNGCMSAQSVLSIIHTTYVYFSNCNSLQCCPVNGIKVIIPSWEAIHERCSVPTWTQRPGDGQGLLLHSAVGG